MSVKLARFREARHRLMVAGETPDDNILRDTLGCVLDLHHAIASVVRSALDDECAASRLRGRMDEMGSRLRVIERRAEKKREMALTAMEEAALHKLDAPGLRIEVRRAPPVLVICDESLVPGGFWTAPPPRLDYPAIREALKGGANVPGVALAAPEAYLSVRTS